MTLHEPRRISGWLLAILCFAAAPLTVVTWFVLIALLWQVARPGPELLISSLGVSAFAAWKLVRLGQRLKAPTAHEILQKDQRPPVLYLRSFDSDTRTITKEGWTPFSSQTEYVPGWSFNTRRLEEVNTKIFKNLGPVIAVAPPGENLPQLGAARLAFEDEKWRGGVRELMQKSQLIVIEYGVSPGLKWEMSEAFQLSPFKPILLSAPVHDDEALLSRQKRYEMLKRALPPGAARLLPMDIGDAAFFFFKKADQVTEIESKAGPPDGLLDVVRPGTLDEMSKRHTRRLTLFFATVLTLLFLIVVWAILSKKSEGYEGGAISTPPNITENCSTS